MCFPNSVVRHRLKDGLRVSKLCLARTLIAMIMHVRAIWELSVQYKLSCTTTTSHL